MPRPRIILADDHRMFAEGLESLLSEDFDVVEIVEDGKALLEAVDRVDPDLVVTDISMPELNGIDVVRHLTESAPDLKVVILTMHDELGLATASLRAGAAGYVLKNSGARSVLRAVEEALAGGVYISEEIAGDVTRSLATGRGADPQLTPRQIEIVRLLVDGLSAKEIAKRVNISSRTVEFHKYQAMERIGVTTNAELIAYGLKNGIGPV